MATKDWKLRGSYREGASGKLSDHVAICCWDSGPRPGELRSSRILGPRFGGEPEEDTREHELERAEG